MIELLEVLEKGTLDTTDGNVVATKMKTEELGYLGNDPGAVKYGNFINYYSFHSVKQRLDNFDPKMFPECKNENGPLLLMDIGCNTGELSKEIFLYSKTIFSNKEIKMLAIDIDPTLIQRAQETNGNSNITFKTCNIMDQSDCSIMSQFLDSNEKTYFDITFCFSVTMWIHINNGDDELKRFLKYLKSVSKTIVIEPQPWNCYRNAQRRLKKSGNGFPLYETLKIRSNVQSAIEEILTVDNILKKVYESPSSSWKRIIQSYQRVA